MKVMTSKPGLSHHRACVDDFKISAASKNIRGLRKQCNVTYALFFSTTEYRQTTSFKRFSENMEKIFDFDDECDISSSIGNGTV